MNRKSLIILIIAPLLILVALIIYGRLSATQPLSISSNSVDLTEIEAQMEYINISSIDTLFLTYKNTAVGKIVGDTNIPRVISEQNILGEIDSLYWYPGGKKMLIGFMNDPETLSVYKNYTDPKTQYIYCTLGVGDKEPIFIRNAPDKVWLTGSNIFGIRNNQLVKFIGSNWENTDIPISESGLLLSSAGKSFGNYTGGKTIIYNETGEQIRKLNKNFSEPLRIRIFDNGDIIYPESNKISVFKASGRNRYIKISKNDQFLAGGNVFIYTLKGKHYISFSGKNKDYLISYDIGEVDYFKIFGLNENGLVYFDGNDYVAKIIRPVK